MNLTIDIGNTRAKAVVFDGDNIAASLVTDHSLSALPQMLADHPCQRGIVSATAPLTAEAEACIAGLPFDVVRLTGLTPTPVRVMYRTPQTLGPDRLAAVVGAWTLTRDRSVLVVDCGTCVTYDLADAEGRYWGGNISPGLEMRLRSLHEHTARLPLVSAEGDTPAVGHDTETAIRSGVVAGLRREILGYIRDFEQKYPRLSVFLTGGDAKKLDISPKFINFADDFLVPRGLNQILNHNR